MKANLKPETRLIPEMYSDIPRCECHFGWDDETTRVFIENIFNELILSGGKEQNFIIPDLGKEANKITSLSLRALGIVKGLEQFSKSVNQLGVSTIPKNSIDISIFKNLCYLGIDWNNKIESEVNEISNLSELGITSYKYKDLTNLNCIGQLKGLNLLQGNLVSLEGINPNLETLSLVRVRNYSDLETINKLKNLKELHCTNIKKAKGIIKLESLNKLESIHVVDCSCILNLKNIKKLKHLKKIWFNGEHTNINWEEIIPIPYLKLVGLYDAEITDDEIYQIAKKANKKIDKLFRAGTKKRPHIQITFSSPEIKIIKVRHEKLPRFECRFGWSDEATKLFKQNETRALLLVGNEYHNFIIPNLGVKGKKISELILGVNGNIEGLNQFTSSVTNLEINTFPKNALILDDFKKVRHLSVEWNEKIEKQIDNFISLQSISIRDYYHSDLGRLKCLQNLKKLSFSLGDLENIDGLNLNLESLSLCFLRNFMDTNYINKLKKLKKINCENLDIAKGTIKLISFKNISSVRVKNTAFKIDFQCINELTNLEVIWVNGEHKNLNWKDIISLPKLKNIYLHDEVITDEEIKLIAKNSNKNIGNIFRNRSNDYTYLQIIFED